MKNSRQRYNIIYPYWKKNKRGCFSIIQ